MEGFDDARHIAAGEVLSLTQPSARRSEFELRRGAAPIGALDWARGRRSVASARVEGLGPLRLEARRGRAVVRSEGREHAMAVVDWDHTRSARITLWTGEEFLLQGHGRRHRWEIRRGHDVIVEIAAFQAFVKASVEMRTNAAVPEETGLLLSVVGGFAALRDLRAQVDAGASVGGMVASGLA